METYAPAFSKVLVTPEPHYIPGYAGYCPQLKFNMGRTYSQHTAELLTSPEVKHSGRLVLRTGHVPSNDTTAPKLIGIPDSDVRKTIPGYTGFIPRTQNYFSHSYADTCRKALTEFYQQRHARALRQSTGVRFERANLPLTPTSDKVFSYKPFVSVTTSPYVMEDDDPQKYFIPGFTGHVPKSRYLMGKGFPLVTNQALIQFGKQQRGDPASQDYAGRKESTTLALPTIYTTNKGLLPSFTGHIPGLKFMFGQTFGQLTKEAVEKSHHERILR